MSYCSHSYGGSQSRECEMSTGPDPQNMFWARPKCLNKGQGFLKCTSVLIVCSCAVRVQQWEEWRVGLRLSSLVGHQTSLSAPHGRFGKMDPKSAKTPKKLTNLTQDSTEDILDRLDDSDFDVSDDENEESKILNTSVRNTTRFFPVGVINSDDSDYNPPYEPPEHCSSSESDDAVDKPSTSTRITQAKAVKRKVGTKNKNPKKKRTDVIPEPEPTWRKNTFSPQPIVVNQPSYFEEDFSAWNVDEYIGQYIPI